MTNTKCSSCGEVHTAGALDAANVILNGRLKIETAFGAKTVCGVANLIDNETQRAGRMLLQEDAERAGHTPGPWKLGREDYAYFEHGGMTIKNSTVGIDGANGDVDICRIVVGDPSGEGRANASLIAAAPELRAALYNLAREHQELLQTHYGHYPMNCIDYAFEALAKSGGAL